MSQDKKDLKVKDAKGKDVKGKDTKSAVQKPEKKKFKFDIIKTFKDMWAELKKVTWPSRKDLIRHSVVVVIFVLILTVFVGLIDAGLSALLKLVI